MAKSHKAQHWIPRSYAAAWVDPDKPAQHEPFLNIVTKDGSAVRRRAPENVFTETDLYTITLPNGARDLRLEHGLSQLEAAFVQVRRDFLEVVRRLPAV